MLQSLGNGRLRESIYMPIYENKIKYNTSCQLLHLQ